MQSIFLYLTLIYSSLNHVLPECNVNSGPSGWIDCIYNSASSSFQLSTCVTNDYIKEKTSNQQLCSNIANAQYCYIPCMAELGLSGATVDTCRCAEGTSIVQSTLPSDCLSSTQVDCSWYRRCLAGQYFCSEEANVAIYYGDKFCNVYNTPPSQVSRIALAWVDAVRKCFQIQLTPVLRSYGIQTSCNDLQQRISDTYSPCYTNNTAAISACDLSCREFAHYFFALNSAYSNGYVALIKDLYITMIQCSQGSTPGANLCGYQCDLFYLPSGAVNSDCVNAAMFELIFESNSIGEANIARLVIEDQTAFKVIAKLSVQFSWDSASSIKWYPRVSPSMLVDEISIQLFIVDIAALGLVNRGSLKNLAEVVKDLADAIKAGLTINLDDAPSLQLRAKYFQMCNPYGQPLGSCNPGQIIATASDVATISPNSVSTSGFQPLTSTLMFPSRRGVTPSMGTPPRQAFTPTKGFSRAGGTPSKESTAGFSTTTIASSSASFSSVSSSSSNFSSLSSILSSSTSLVSTTTGSTIVSSSIQTIGFTRQSITPGLSGSATTSSRTQGNDTTPKENTPAKSSITKRIGTPTQSGSAVTRNFTPGFSRPTINP